MPFTPFHMGPAMLAGAPGRYFSVLAFGLAQVAMDIEPLVGLLSGADVLHGRTHTWIIAPLIGLAVGAVSLPLCRGLLAGWHEVLNMLRLPWLCTPGTLSRAMVMRGALAGTLSHVLLDSIMHGDITPFWPFSSSNPLLDLISIPSLHGLCLTSGLLGILLWVGSGFRRRMRRIASPE